MDIPLFRKLFGEGLIDDTALAGIEAYEKSGPVSVWWDLLTILYSGIFLLTTGLGIIIYKNLDSIGHIAITIFIASGVVACFFYCIKNARGYQSAKVVQVNVWFDYILLAGCLLLLILTAYLQFEFGLFGNRYGMATFIPMVILFISAYYFDHIGVLSLAITNCAAWVGLTVTPSHLLRNNDFNSNQIIYSAIGLGVVLLVVAAWSNAQNIKRHFSFTYKNFGTHLLFVALIAALVAFQRFQFIWFVVLASVFYYLFKEAIKERSFYFLVVGVLYFYIGLSYQVVHLLFKADGGGEGVIYVALFYFIFSGIGIVIFLMRYNKIIKQHAGL